MKDTASGIGSIPCRLYRLSQDKLRYIYPYHLSSAVKMRKLVQVHVQDSDEHLLETPEVPPLMHLIHFTISSVSTLINSRTIIFLRLNDPF